MQTRVVRQIVRKRALSAAGVLLGQQPATHHELNCVDKSGVWDFRHPLSRGPSGYHNEGDFWTKERLNRRGFSKLASLETTSQAHVNSGPVPRQHLPTLD